MPMEKTDAACPVFGICGGCAYQDILYEEELKIKEDKLKELFRRELGIPESCFDDIVPSPKPYHYRHRLDVGAIKSKTGEFLMGFMSEEPHRMVSIESCSIADERVSDFLPQLKRLAEEKWLPGYKRANLVVKTDDSGRLFWGGIGRRSLSMCEEDYLFVDVDGKRIFYALDTFFQANLSILPHVMSKIKSLGVWNPAVEFYDLYGGVGLFGICLSDYVGRVVVIEECEASARLAKYNTHYHDLAEKVEIVKGSVEDHLPAPLDATKLAKRIAIVDPPRKGLKVSVINALAEAFDGLLYLSCSPHSLVRDLKFLMQRGWVLDRIIPLDFFPKTRHLETLVYLVP